MKLFLQTYYFSCNFVPYCFVEFRRSFWTFWGSTIQCSLDSALRSKINHQSIIVLHSRFRSRLRFLFFVVALNIFMLFLFCLFNLFQLIWFSIAQIVRCCIFLVVIAFWSVHNVDGVFWILDRRCRSCFCTRFKFSMLRGEGCMQAGRMVQDNFNSTFSSEGLGNFDERFHQNGFLHRIILTFLHDVSILIFHLSASSSRSPKISLWMIFNLFENVFTRITYYIFFFHSHEILCMFSSRVRCEWIETNIP